MLNKKALCKISVEVKASPIHRYGVFALHNIHPGEIIEECPVVLVDVEYTSLGIYWFHWKPDSKKKAIALGNGTIYNHAEDPNAFFELDYDRELIVFKAKKLILAGEEIMTYYNKNWFQEKGIKMKSYPPKNENIILLVNVLLVVMAVVMGVVLLK